MLSDVAGRTVAAAVEPQEDGAFVEEEERSLSLKRRCPGLTFAGKSPSASAAVGSGRSQKEAFPMKPSTLAPGLAPLTVRTALPQRGSNTL